MTPVRFIAGMEDELRGGFSYRIRHGRKGPDDLILELRCTNRWTPVPMELGFLMADFFKQNEDALYPPSFDFRGGSMYINALLASVRHGWKSVADELWADRVRRSQRDGAYEKTDREVAPPHRAKEAVE